MTLRVESHNISSFSSAHSDGNEASEERKRTLLCKAKGIEGAKCRMQQSKSVSRKKERSLKTFSSAQFDASLSLTSSSPARITERKKNVVKHFKGK